MPTIITSLTMRSGVASESQAMASMALLWVTTW